MTDRIVSAKSERNRRAENEDVFAHYDTEYGSLLLIADGMGGAEAGYDNIPIDEAFAVFDKIRNEPELFPDVRPVLESLKKRYTLVAVTDGNANLDKIGISDLFDEFVSAQTAGAAKPDRRIFDAAVSVGGAPQAQTLHVGDHPEKDVQGARDAGLKTVWINRDEADWPETLAAPDRVVTDLYELDRILVPLR